MTIERGQDWGAPAQPGSIDSVASSNSELRALIEDARLTSESQPKIGVIGGDLWKALGSPSGGLERLEGSDARQVSVDLIECQLDGRRCFAAAHVFFLSSWWLGPVTAVMNSEWWGSWLVAPRAHPNDGRLDLVEGDLPIRQRLLIRRRVLTGDHLPNSALKVGRIAELKREFVRPMRVIIDGVEEDRCRHLSLQVLPDALSIIY